MGKVILWGLLLYPILWGIDYITKSQLVQTYHQFIMDWWPVGIVIIATYYLVRNITTFRNAEMEILRERQYLHEIMRYRSTPFIPSIMLMYLTNPPRSFSPYDSDYINNTFYQTVVNTFRDRVYVMADFHHAQPVDRLPYYRIVGFKLWSRLILYFGLSFGWLSYWVLTAPSMLLNDWPLFTLPFVVWGLAKSTMLIQVITEHIPSHLEKKLDLESAFQERHTWRETFPDTSIGQTIVRAYEMEKESRMRYLSIIRQLPVPETTEHFHHPSFPPYPFPSKHIPEWSGDMENLYNDKLQEWRNPKSSSQKVIPLRRKSK